MPRDPPDDRVPWHFWLLIGGVALYLGWRVVQGFQWLLENEQYVWAGVCAVALAALLGGGAFYAFGRVDDDESSASEAES